MITIVCFIIIFSMFKQYSFKECHAYIKDANRQPPRYWSTYNVTTLVLKEPKIQTKWNIKTFRPYLQNTIQIMVEQSPDSHVNGHYLCILEHTKVSLCDNSSLSNMNQYYTAFEYSLIRNFVFRLSTQDKTATKRYLQAKDQSFELFQLGNQGTEWTLHTPLSGCDELFNIPTTFHPTTTPTIPTTTTSLSTTETSTTSTKTARNIITTVFRRNATTSRTTAAVLLNTTSKMATEVILNTKTALPITLPITTKQTTIPAKNKTCTGQMDGSWCFKASSVNEVKKIIENQLKKLNNNIQITNESVIQEVDEAVLSFSLEMENFGLRIAKSLKENVSMDVGMNTLRWLACKQTLPFVHPRQDNQNMIQLHSSNRNNNTLSIFGVLYDDFHKYLKKKIVLHGKGIKNNTKFQINSKLISASILSASPIALSVVVKLSNLVEVTTKDITKCAFWNQTGKTGFWSTEGCMKDKKVSTRATTTCICNHLTNFAVLTSFVDFEIPEVHQSILSTMTLICSSISIVFLFIGISLFLLLLCGQIKHTRHIIHLNLMVALFLAQCLYVTGIDAVSNKEVCQSIAMILHYLLLASFGWMFVEGVHLYFAVVKVFSDSKKYLRWYILYAWGLPAVVVTITASVNNNWYGTKEYCWLTTEDSAIWAFLGPVVCIVLANTIILCIIINQIVHLAKTEGVVDDIKTGVRSSLILLPILGVTWIFGVLSFNSKTLVFQYIFAITNSLQGLMITMFHCFLNSEVRKTLQRKLQIWTHTTSRGQHLRVKNRTHLESTVSSTAQLNMLHNGRSEVYKVLEEKSYVTRL